MSLLDKLRTKGAGAPVGPAGGPDDRDLVAFVNEARTDAERRAVVGLAALRARGGGH
jgi:hypothetical protein